METKFTCQNIIEICHNIQLAEMIATPRDRNTDTLACNECPASCWFLPEWGEKKKTLNAHNGDIQPKQPMETCRSDSFNPEASVLSFKTVFQCLTYQNSLHFRLWMPVTLITASEPQCTFRVNKGIMYLQCFDQRLISARFSHQNNPRLHFWQQVWERKAKQSVNNEEIHTLTSNAGVTNT